VVGKESVKNPLTAEKTEDCVKAAFTEALRQRFASALSQKHSQQDQQAKEYRQPSGYIREDHVQPAGGQHKADKRPGEYNEHEQETATPSQRGPSSPALSLAILSRLVSRETGCKPGHE
jgi:hypothetical protein